MDRASQAVPSPRMAAGAPDKAEDEGITMKPFETIGLAGAAAMTLGLAAGAAHADPLASPAMTPPLAANANPIGYATGFGKIYLSGQLTGLGLWQDNSVPGDKDSRADLSNAQLEVQKTDGVVQFYIQGGAYSLPSLGAPYVKADKLPDLTYKWVPLAYVKIAPNANFSIMAGKLPTLIGAEYTFTFQNMNVARGLLWNQEPAISRGVQANFTQGPWAVSLSVNDGYYSNRFTTGSALVTYTIGKQDTVAAAGSVQFRKTSKASLATPVPQNNGDIFNLIWTHTEGNWQVIPYLQYGHTPKSTRAGLPASGSAFGGAVLAKYSFNPSFSLAGRAEYIASSGGQSLLYGPKSRAWSLTLTPTWQLKTFFIRGEVSYTGLDKAAPGAGFGATGDKDSQARAMVETGVLF
ncbi:MAG TPA: outer membrane beta-barrel protein [Phenylobacterium sp.]|uniref:outer membrane beta-barrel protein n=1 Tax=Phenylobacterium sp. TaxID=1871053 RepID=UPI002C652429|nr:outer membrane beta-barrel protein [Phenylobacterium sp.]HSV03595.1 outer membrane beta-barrel protein [Phenylobacterium sp.]